MTVVTSALTEATRPDWFQERGEETVVKVALGYEEAVT